MSLTITCPKCGFHYQLESAKGAPRTTGRGSQNSHAWGHSTQIAKEIGEDGRDVLYEACIRAAPDYPTRMSAWGKILPKRWSLATVAEASIVIERLHQFAVELNIILVDDKWEGV
jgi:hypothetical protein